MYLKKSKYIPYLILTVLVIMLCYKMLSAGTLVFGDRTYVSNTYNTTSIGQLWSSELLGNIGRSGFYIYMNAFFRFISFTDYMYYFLAYILPIFLIVYSYYYYLTKIGTDRYNSKLLSLLAISNPIFYGDFINGQTLWPYVTMPWAFYFLDKYTTTQSKNYFYATILSVAYIVGISTPNAIPLVIGLVLYFVVKLAMNKMMIKFILRNISTLLLGVLVLALLSLPILILSRYGAESVVSGNALKDFSHNYSAYEAFNAFRLAGNNGNAQAPLGFNDTGNIYNAFAFTAILFISFNIIYSKHKSKQIISYFLVFILLTLSAIMVNEGYFDSYITKLGLITSAMRNPNKLQQVILPVFITLFALSINKYAIKNLRKSYVISLLVLVSISGGIVLNGDFGLSRVKPIENYNYNSDLVNLAEESNLNKNRSVIIPSDHNTALHYQNISTSLNTYRLGGGFSASRTALDYIITSASKGKQKYTLDILGITDVYYEKNKLTDPEVGSLIKASGLVFNEQKYGYIHYSNNDAYNAFEASNNVASSNSKSLAEIYSLYNEYDHIINDASSKIFTDYYESTNSIEALTNLSVDTVAAIDNSLITNYRVSMGNNNDTIELTTAFDKQLIPIDKTNNPLIIGLNEANYIIDRDKMSIALSTKIPNDYITIKNTVLLKSELELNLANSQLSNASVNKLGAPNIDKAIFNENGRTTVSLSTRNHTAYSEFVIDTSEYADRELLIEYNTRNHIGKSGYVVIYDESYNLLEKNDMPTGDKWQKSSLTLKPKSKLMRIAFYTDTFNNIESVNYITDIKLYAVGKSKNIEVLLSKSTDSIASTRLPNKPSIIYDSLNIESLYDWSIGYIPARNSDNIDNIKKSNDVYLKNNNAREYIRKSISIKPNEQYKISITHKGDAGSIGIITDEKELYSTLPKSLKDKESIFDIPTSEKERDVVIYLYAPNELGSININRIQIINTQNVSNILTLKNMVEKNTKLIKINDTVKISNTRYNLKINGHNGFIFFNESYNKNWLLYVHKNELKVKNNKYHYLANSYANAWYIDVNDLCVQRKLCTQAADGSWDIDLIVEFTPQRWFYVGSIISGTTFVGVVGYLVYDTMHRRKNRKLSIAKQSAHSHTNTSAPLTSKPRTSSVGHKLRLRKKNKTYKG